MQYTSWHTRQTLGLSLQEKGILSLSLSLSFLCSLTHSLSLSHTHTHKHTHSQVVLDNLRVLILDEADRMLDMGFEPDVRRIVSEFNAPEKGQRQTLMFSATFPEEIQKLAADFLNDHIFLTVGVVGGTTSDIQQNIVEVTESEKREKLQEILSEAGKPHLVVRVHFSCHVATC